VLLLIVVETGFEPSTPILYLTCSLPYVEQMLLANSMIVGKEDHLDLINWECNVCDNTNRPLHAHYIE
jgi:hypothetical protein